MAVAHAARGSFVRESLVTLTDSLDQLINVALEPLLTQAVTVATVRKCLGEVSKFGDETWNLLLRRANRIASGRFRAVVLRAIVSYLDDFYGVDARVSFLIPVDAIPKYILRQFLLRAIRTC